VTPELRDLYQEVILDHGRRPRNFRVLADADRRTEGYNPLCGDRLTLYVRLDGDVIREVTFQGSGCAISTASASLLTETVVGKRVDEAEAIFGAFHALLTGEERGEGKPASLGKLDVFAGVGEFPARVKCATLPWHTLHAALERREEPVTTE
jgi:nitrogen fixation protein NifU and related proteins